MQIIFSMARGMGVELTAGEISEMVDGGNSSEAAWARAYREGERLPESTRTRNGVGKEILNDP